MLAQRPPEGPTVQALDFQSLSFPSLPRNGPGGLGKGGPGEHDAPPWPKTLGGTPVGGGGGGEGGGGGVLAQWAPLCGGRAYCASTRLPTLRSASLPRNPGMAPGELGERILGAGGPPFGLQRLLGYLEGGALGLAKAGGGPGREGAKCLHSGYGGPSMQALGLPPVPPPSAPLPTHPEIPNRPPRPPEAAPICPSPQTHVHRGKMQLSVVTAESLGVTGVLAQWAPVYGGGPTVQALGLQPSILLPLSPESRIGAGRRWEMGAWGAGRPLFGLQNPVGHPRGAVGLAGSGGALGRGSARSACTAGPPL